MCVFELILQHNLSEDELHCVSLMLFKSIGLKILTLTMPTNFSDPKIEVGGRGWMDVWIPI
jgi:hypothetical protein